jgi:uncharacterized membrane protein HdeD (DUF308 family)
MASGLLGGIKDNAKLAITVGILLIIVGLLAIAAPMAAGLSITIAVGTLLIIGGIGECFLAFQAGAFGKGLQIFIVGALMAVAGFYLVSQPVSGLVKITLFLSAYFIVSGIFEVIAAVQIRPSSGWGLMLFNGIVTLLLGIMLWRQYPLSGAWAVGVLFGIKMVFSGWTLIFIGNAVKGAVNEAAAPSGLGE